MISPEVNSGSIPNSEFPVILDPTRFLEDIYIYIYSSEFHQLWWIDFIIYKSLLDFQQVRRLDDRIILPLTSIARLIVPASSSGHGFHEAVFSGSRRGKGGLLESNAHKTSK